MLLPVCIVPNPFAVPKLTLCYTELDTLSEESYKDSTLIMQLLRDNLVGRFFAPVVLSSTNMNSPRLSGPPRRLSPLPLRPPLLLRRSPRLLHLRKPRLRLNRCSVPALMFGPPGTSERGWIGILACFADEVKVRRETRSFVRRSIIRNLLAF